MGGGRIRRDTGVDATTWSMYSSLEVEGWGSGVSVRRSELSDVVALELAVVSGGVSWVAAGGEITGVASSPIVDWDSSRSSWHYKYNKGAHIEREFVTKLVKP